MTKVVLFVGTRPEIIKMSPVYKALKKRSQVNVLVLFSGQHFSYSMSELMFQEAEYELEDIVNTKMVNEHRSLAQADMLFVQGDTKTTALGAVEAIHYKVPLAHVEAGLRSHDRRMREERNREMVDKASDLLFCPTNMNARTCTAEANRGDVFVVGNTIVDVITDWKKETGFKVIPRFERDRRVVITLHRPELVDDLPLFDYVLSELWEFLRKHDLRAIWPVHPRVQALANTPPPFVELVEPVGYKEMFRMQSESCLVITDSGGLQEESCILGTPCITLRPNTERPETMLARSNFVMDPSVNKMETGCLEDRLRQAWSSSFKEAWIHPYGENVGEKIVDAALGWLNE